MTDLIQNFDAFRTGLRSVFGVVFSVLNSARIRTSHLCKRGSIMQQMKVICCIPCRGSFSRRNSAVETVPLFATQTSQFSF